jgi:uncharacterized membrane protein YdjX (TVP38/TMEM64 family)
VAAVKYGPWVYQVLTSPQALEDFLSAAGPWAPLGFVLLNILQVIFAPIPGMVSATVGGFLFGAWNGFLLNSIGIFLGSCLAFWLARLLGKPLVDMLVGKKTSDLLSRLSEGKGLWGLALCFLLPFLPDDALCLVAGLTPMKFGTFALIAVTCRAPGTFVASLTGSGVVRVPLWGWAIIGVLALGLLYFGWRYSSLLERWKDALLNRVLPAGKKESEKRTIQRDRG